MVVVDLLLAGFPKGAMVLDDPGPNGGGHALGSWRGRTSVGFVGRGGVLEMGVVVGRGFVDRSVFVIPRSDGGSLGLGGEAESEA